MKTILCPDVCNPVESTEIYTTVTTWFEPDYASVEQKLQLKDCNVLHVLLLQTQALRLDLHYVRIY